MPKAFTFCIILSAALGILTLYYGRIFYSGLFYLICIAIGIASSYFTKSSLLFMVALSVMFSVLSVCILSIIRLGYFGL